MFVRPAITTWVLISNSPFPLVINVFLTASLRRRPAMVVNSAISIGLKLVQYSKKFNKEKNGKGKFVNSL